MNRVYSHIPGLDRLLEGGFPEGSAILIQGPPGTGKTIMGLQFLYKAARRDDVPGMLIQSEDFPKSLEWYSQTFGWDLAHIQQLELLSIFSFKPKDYGKFKPQTIEGEFISKIGKLIIPKGIQRVVFDSISSVGESVGSEADYRQSFYKLIEFLKQNNVTTMIIAEDDPEREFEEHVCDGVIKLRSVEGEGGRFNKELMVSKMLATNIAPAWYPMTITDRGITVRPFR